MNKCKVILDLRIHFYYDNHKIVYIGIVLFPSVVHGLIFVPVHLNKSPLVNHPYFLYIILKPSKLESRRLINKSAKCKFFYIRNVGSRCELRWGYTPP
jgi:hypothetical protein